MIKRYRLAADVRLVFPDGQIVEGLGTEFERDYDPVQEQQHLYGGHIEVVSVPVTSPQEDAHGEPSTE